MREKQDNETTLYRLRNDTAFMELVEIFKQAMYGETMRKAQADSLEALELPKEVASDKAAPPSSSQIG